MRFQRVPDIPHGELAIVVRKPGRAPVVLLNGQRLNEDAAARLGRRICSDPDLLKAIGEDGV
jgi:hypothetical protein